MKPEYKGYKGKQTQTYKKLYGYKNLLVWQAADDLAERVHNLTRRFGPGYYEHANQMLGSATSAKSNIAEGYCRNALGDYIRFCEIARGSLGELGSQIQDCDWDRSLGVSEEKVDYRTASPPTGIDLPEDMPPL